MTSTSDQRWDPAQYGRNARYVSDLGMPVVALLDPQPGERILDLGCGDGALTLRLAGLGCAIVGVDSSPEMIAAAQALGLDARVVDGQALPFDCEFDAVFSNAALHWMRNPQATLRGVARALKPGGRFVGEFGGHGNVATIIVALEAALAARGLAAPMPWYFPRAEAFEDLLRASGFSVREIALIPRPTALPGDVGGWLETFAQSYLHALPAAERPAFLAEVVQALRAPLCNADGHWHADYVRLRFCAILEPAAS